MIPISQRTILAAARTVKNPNLVLVIDGVPTIYGATPTLQLIKIGDPGLLIGNDWIIGGSTEIPDSEVLLSLSGSSTSINQQLDADKGRGSSIQSLDIELVDLQGMITKLITPGMVVDDILGRKAKIYLAIDAASAQWPDDYLLLFRGVVDDIKGNQASVTLTISHPDQKKKQALYAKAETTLDGAITNVQTTITLASTAGLLLPVTGPDGVIDNSFGAHVRIDDEIIKYTGISGNQLTGCVRGQLNTFAAAHADDVEVVSFYRLQGTAMDLALKLMLSQQGPYLEALEPTSFQVLPGPISEPNAIYFEGIDVSIEYGLTVGDYITTTLATNPANNVSLKEITSIVKTTLGSYITVDGVSFVDESTTSALLSIRSKYDSLPQGLGLGADEVDVTQHEYLRRQFLSSFLYDFYLKDTIDNVRDFLDAEIYKPASAYSVPRKAQASVQMLIGPLPGGRIATFDQSNIINPASIRLRRSIGKNFYNTIVYRYEDDELEDKFLRTKITTDVDSLNQIKVGPRPLIVESKGLRITDQADALAGTASNRRLNRYRFGAEYVEGLKVTFGAGFDVELGDIVIIDFSQLNVPNTSDGTRSKPAALFEVANKKLNYKTGEVQLDLVDTAFDENARYGLIGPSSRIKTSIDASSFVIEQSFGALYGAAEFQKWQRYPNCAVTVRSPDSTARYGQSVILTSTSNTITLATPLGFTPQVGDIMELAPYANATDQIKLVYGHLSPLTGGDPDYLML